MLSTSPPITAVTFPDINCRKRTNVHTSDGRALFRCCCGVCSLTFPVALCSIKVNHGLLVSTSQDRYILTAIVPLCFQDLTLSVANKSKPREWELLGGRRIGSAMTGSQSKWKRIFRVE